MNDQQLVANVMANLFRIDIVGGLYPRMNASLVMEVFAVGSTTAYALCRRHGLDPDETQPAERHQEYWCDGCREVVDCDVKACHGCNRRICVDNCVHATNDEHGLDFCEECHLKYPPEQGGEPDGGEGGAN